MTQYVIGCDIGSQGAKAVLVAADGTLAGEATASYAIDYPHPLWAEQPPERWIDALTGVIRTLLATAAIAPAQVRAIGLASQVDGVVPVDAALRPLHPAIIWMDRRATRQIAAVREICSAEEALECAGLNLDASHVAPKIRWLMETYPDLATRTAYYLLPGSYMAAYLTGSVAVDYSNASSTLLMDVRTRQWSPALCAAFGVDATQLGPIVAATAPLGTLRPEVAELLGLDPATLVLVGCGDEHAACLGAGVIRPGLIGDIAGTAEPVCASSTAPLVDATGLVETHCHADPDLWLIENPGFVSGGNLRWYRDNFGPDEVRAAAGGPVSAYALLDGQAAQIAPGADGVIFLPCLMGAMAPTWNEAARGVFFGFTLAHSRAHFTRAVLEGSAYALRDITDRMRAIGLPTDELRVMGGGARSPLWNQIKADVTGLPVSVPQTTETTALGGALLALVGMGWYADLTAACAATVQIVAAYTPRREFQAIYDAHYQLYRALYFAAQPAFAAAERLPAQV